MGSFKIIFLTTGNRAMSDCGILFHNIGLVEETRDICQETGRKYEVADRKEVIKA